MKNKKENHVIFQEKVQILHTQYFTAQEVHLLKS